VNKKAECIAKNVRHANFFSKIYFTDCRTEDFKLFFLAMMKGRLYLDTLQQFNAQRKLKILSCNFNLASFNFNLAGDIMGLPAASKFAYFSHLIILSVHLSLGQGNGKSINCPVLKISVVCVD
jgi:hypothetical protein